MTIIIIHFLLFFIYFILSVYGRKFGNISFCHILSNQQFLFRTFHEIASTKSKFSIRVFMRNNMWMWKYFKICNTYNLFVYSFILVPRIYYYYLWLWWTYSYRSLKKTNFDNIFCEQQIRVLLLFASFLDFIESFLLIQVIVLLE